MPHRRSSTNVIARFEELRPFASKEEVQNYLTNERLECLLCGKLFVSLGVHLAGKHKMSVRAYKIKLKLPLTEGLVGSSLKQKMKVEWPRNGILMDAAASRKAHGSVKNPGGCREYRNLIDKENRDVLGPARREFNKRAKRRTRLLGLEIIRTSETGDSMWAAALRLGVAAQKVTYAFRKHRDLRAAFYECVRNNHA